MLYHLRPTLATLPTRAAFFRPALVRAVSVEASTLLGHPEADGPLFQHKPSQNTNPGASTTHNEPETDSPNTLKLKTKEGDKHRRSHMQTEGNHGFEDLRQRHNEGKD